MSFDVRINHAIGDRQLELELEFHSTAGLTALVGPSGAGKTTVLNCIAGLVRPDSGRIAVGERVLFDSEEGVDLAPQERRAGYLFQDARLFPHMRVAGNLAYGERLAQPEERWIPSEDVISFLGIGQLLERWPDTLSGGEVRRVAIGRALLAGSRFLLLDEPLASLDRERVEGLVGLIERIRDELAIPILLVDHERSQVERLAGHLIELA